MREQQIDRGRPGGQGIGDGRSLAIDRGQRVAARLPVTIVVDQAAVTASSPEGGPPFTTSSTGFPIANGLFGVRATVLFAAS